jgi:hypothetical protein
MLSGGRTCILAVAAALIGATTALASSPDPLDKTRLPLGDGQVTTSGPKKNFVYRCNAGTGGGGGAFQDGPWIDDNSYDLTAKAIVDGSVEWPQAAFSSSVSGSTRTLAGNGLPTTHTTGVYPISSSDDAYQYDRNPNSIRAQTVNYSVPAEPRKADSPTCVQGAVGIAKNGVTIFDGLDALNRDAVAHETQDRCGGHPEVSGTYHYHSIPTCLSGTTKKKQSKLVGWALDGFPIFGPRDPDGTRLTNDDLDKCHGQTSRVRYQGEMQRIYHYNATLEFPYTVGCFRGTP